MLYLYLYLRGIRRTTWRIRYTMWRTVKFRTGGVPCWQAESSNGAKPASPLRLIR
ncbi:MAG: hypothetical protein MJA29_11935 [Candidatus Omnitrophica bacterium]|nr:hypothetical protein [Candidatus Omnitrophota bacterium]